MADYSVCMCIRADVTFQTQKQKHLILFLDFPDLQIRSKILHGLPTSATILNCTSTAVVKREATVESS